ncbi:helix-turn-helix transcriptional regulator [Arthrobacter methylotrophus]|uniref:Helix-turn-helix transcriptional regulator n=1 Tax=Arthrobacter methylotrophus TaxID=121291 RepID=A0ABV5UR63_9MICC
MTAVGTSDSGRTEIGAEHLRLARRHIGLTQAGLADRLGVSPRTIVNWEATGVPARRVPHVERRIGAAIREARECERSVQGGPPCEITEDHPCPCSSAIFRQ